MDCSMPGLPVHHKLNELAQTHVHWVSDVIQPSHSLSSPSPPAFNLAQHQGLFQWVSYLNQVAKVLEFSFSISPSNEYLGLISFRMDWLDLLVVQGVSSIFSSATVQNHQLFGPQLSLQSNFCIHINYGKTIALTRQTFVSKVMSLLFYMLSSLVIAFLPRSKHHLISWLQSPSAVILEPKKIKDSLYNKWCWWYQIAKCKIKMNP